MKLSAYPEYRKLFLWIDLAPPILLIAFLSWLGPWWSVYELDTDEGIALMVGALAAEGYPLYSQVWNDHPPVMFWVLSVVHDLSGGSVAAARILVLSLAAALTFGLFRIVRREEGLAAAVVAVVCLAAGQRFQVLSVSVMFGLPAIALVVLALDQAMVRDGRRWRCALSGVFLGLSVCTKMFGALLIPVLLLAVWVGRPAGPGGAREALARVGIGAAAFLFVLAAVAAFVGDSLVAQLVKPHFQGALAEAYPYDHGAGRLRHWLTREPHLLVLAAAGLLAAALVPPRRLPGRLIPAAWAVLATAVLVTHVPLWSHHLLILSVPLAWIGGWTAAAAGQALRASGRIPVRVGAVGAAILILGAGIGLALPQAAQTRQVFSAPAPDEDLAATRRLAEGRGESPWVVTDRPMDAYRAGLLVPPPIAVYSEKRIKGGLLAPEEVKTVLEVYRPQQVSYRRFFMGKPARAYLKARYRRVPDTPGQALFRLPSGGA